MRFSDLTGRRAAVWGHGREGRSVAEHLRGLGVDVVVAEPDLAGNDPAIAYGAAGRAALLAADVVVKSPGVPVTSELFLAVRAAGVAVTSLSDLWTSDNAHRTVAVTGSKGKSTTSSLIDHVLRAAGVRSSLRGNIGTSLLEETDPPAEVVVVEVSSYQAQSLTVSPRVCVVTSLFPEHLTWHGSAEAYYADKLNLVAHGPEVVVVPGDAPDVRRRVEALMAADVAADVAAGVEVVATEPGTVHVDDAGDVVWADGTRLASADLPLRGRHQAANIALAALTCGRLGVDAATCAAAVRTFAPLPHRMERVPSGDGRTWIDDSLATAPEAVAASLASLDAGPVALVVGGSDRGLDHAPLLAALRGRDDVELLLVGPAGRRLHRDTGLGRLFGSFAEAVAWARSEANPCPTVLLSPGAPSHDEFTSYEQRAAAFRAAAL